MLVCVDCTSVKVGGMANARYRRERLVKLPTLANILLAVYLVIVTGYFNTYRTTTLVVLVMVMVVKLRVACK